MVLVDLHIDVFVLHHLSFVIFFNYKVLFANIFSIGFGNHGFPNLLCFLVRTVNIEQLIRKGVQNCMSTNLVGLSPKLKLFGGWFSRLSPCMSRIEKIRSCHLLKFSPLYPSILEMSGNYFSYEMVGRIGILRAPLVAASALVEWVSAALVAPIGSIIL